MTEKSQYNDILSTYTLLHLTLWYYFTTFILKYWSLISV